MNKRKYLYGIKNVETPSNDTALNTTFKVY